MEPENLNTENSETVSLTRWMLAIGLGGILLFIVVAYLWLGLTTKPNSSNPTPALVNPVTVTASTSVAAAYTTPYFPIFESTTSPVVATTIIRATASTTSQLAATSTPFVIILPTIPVVPTNVPFPTSTPLPTPYLPADTATPFATATDFYTPTPLDTATPTPTDIPLPTITEPPSVALPKLAAQKFDQLQTLHFIIEIRAGKVEILPSTTLKRAEGDLSHSNRFQAHVQAHVLVGDITIQTIGVDGDQYITNPLGGGWTKLGAGQTFNLSVLFDTQNGIGGIVRQLQNVKVVGNETVANVVCVHLTGTLPGSAVGPISYGTLGRNPVSLDVWLGQDDNIIRQIYLKEQTNNGAFWAINLSNFDQTLNIQKP